MSNTFCCRHFLIPLVVGSKGNFIKNGSFLLRKLSGPRLRVSLDWVLFKKKHKGLSFGALQTSSTAFDPRYYLGLSWIGKRQRLECWGSESIFTRQEADEAYCLLSSKLQVLTDLDQTWNIRKRKGTFSWLKAPRKPQSRDGPRSRDGPFLVQTGELSFSAKSLQLGEAHFPSPTETGDIRHHVYRSSAMFSHLLKCPYFLASKQEEFYTYLFTQVFELSGEPSNSLVLELLSPEGQVYSIPTKDPSACQEKQPSSCILACAVQALKYYLKVIALGKIKNLRPYWYFWGLVSEIPPPKLSLFSSILFHWLWFSQLIKLSKLPFT